MAHSFHEFDFPFHALPSLWFNQLSLFVDFDGDTFISRFMQANPDYSISALPDDFANEEVFKASGGRSTFVVAKVIVSSSC